MIAANEPICGTLVLGISAADDSVPPAVLSYFSILQPPTSMIVIDVSAISPYPANFERSVTMTIEAWHTAYPGVIASKSVVIEEVNC